MKTKINVERRHSKNASLNTGARSRAGYQTGRGTGARHRLKMIPITGSTYLE
jgi:hypothetical protein